MPTYEYECQGCGHRFDEFQSMKDEPLSKCPKCKKKQLQRLIGAGAALLFKGSGFYITDYRSDSYKAAAKADQPAKSDAAGDSSSSKSASPPAPSTGSGSDAKK